MEQISIRSNMFSHENRETYKMIRTKLQYCGENVKVIAVTSSVPREGKSYSTVQLASSLADTGKKVLLIDADLRKPTIKNYFFTHGNHKGLSEFLEKKEPLAGVIKMADRENFHILFAGEVAENSVELLDGEQMRAMITAAKKVYDYIIIDTPPIGRVTDAVVIAKLCDGIVWVIQSGLLSYRYLKKMKKQLEVTDCQILGCILNKVRKQKALYGKYGKYGSYGIYGSYGEYGRKG